MYLCYDGTTQRLQYFSPCVLGSPFHPRVVDARKVRAKGEWQSKLDKDQRIQLEVGKTKTLMFDVSEAGPGMLHCTSFKKPCTQMSMMGGDSS